MHNSQHFLSITGHKRFDQNIIAPPPAVDEPKSNIVTPIFKLHCLLLLFTHVRFHNITLCTKQDVDDLGEAVTTTSLV